MAAVKRKEDNTLNKYCEKEPVDEREILFDGHDIDWVFSKTSLRDIQKMWRQELHVNYMATLLDRKDPDEIVLAVMHLARESKLVKRKYGLLDGIHGPYDKNGRFKR